MRGGYTFSEDEVGEFSQNMFEEFSLPSINRLSKRYGGCGMHCCAHSRHVWDGFNKIEGLRLINLGQPIAILKQSASFFGRSMCHFPHQSLDNQPQSRPIPEWTAAYDRDAHLVLQVNARDEDEARAFASQLREYTHA